MQLAHDIELNQETEPAPSYALEIVGLSKRFRRLTAAKGGYTTLKSYFLGLFLRRAKTERRVTQAIRDITLRIPRGASVGVIGRNGSGKSTLLKLITGIYKPDSGTVSVHGKVAALIELGAGFHPDFTGRENLYLGGVMHGLTRKQIDQRFAQIVDFAELSEVIDDPVRTYSSGMFMRLGFSLAVHTDPDILLVDEVLAVGDAAFVAKCKERIAELRRAGKTLLLVTHDLEAVERWCDEVLWLEAGQVKDRGDPRRVIDHYRQFVEKGEEQELLDQAQGGALPHLSAEPAETQRGRWGSREIEILGVRLLGADRSEHRLFHTDQSMSVEFDFVAHTAVEDLVFGVALHRADGLLAFGTNTQLERVKLPALRSRGTVRFEVSRLGLLEGAYSVDVAAHRLDGYPFDYHKGALDFKVRSAYPQVGVYEPEHKWHVEMRD